MSKQPDDLEAVRTIAGALEPFDHKDRDRIMRWVREKLGMGSVLPAANAPTSTQPAPPTALPAATPSAPTTHPASGDIRSFIESKRPSTDNQFAACVAYYYRFEAAEGDRKETINKDDLVESCRLVGRSRPAKPAQVLVNALAAGILDRGDRGYYRINTIGENLVAMVLPDEDASNSSQQTRAKRRKAAKKGSGNKRAGKKAAKKPGKKSAKKRASKKTR